MVVSYPKSNHSNHENRGAPYKTHTLHKSKGICSIECSRETLQKTPTQFRNDVIGDRKMTKGNTYVHYYTPHKPIISDECKFNPHVWSFF